VTSLHLITMNFAAILVLMRRRVVNGRGLGYRLSDTVGISYGFAQEATGSGTPCGGLYVVLAMEAGLYNAVSASIIHIS
jgi:hypothetical protein